MRAQVLADRSVESREPTRRPALAWRPDVTVADAGAGIACLLLLLYLAGDDGGRPLPVLTWAVALSATACIPLVGTLRHLGRGTVVMVVGVGAGPVIAWSLAPFRAGGGRPMLVGVATAIAFLAARHLATRRWGLPVIGALVAAALIRAWYAAFLAWWGAGMSGGSPQWLALSWHNQSGTLMAVGVVSASALAIGTRGRVRAFAIVTGSAMAAGCWLSGSRGAVIAAAVGIVVILTASRHGGWRRLAGGIAALAVGSLLIVAGLSALTPSAQHPVSARVESAEGNLVARFGHTEAALRVALAHPVTGAGPGSYRWSSRPAYPTDTNLTASAHNEYAEAFAETGIVGGLPVALAAMGAAWLVWGRARRRPDTAATDQASVATAAAAGVAATLGLHAGADFDWDYALLPVLLATAVAVLHAHRGRGRDTRATVGAVTAVAAGVAMAAAAGISVWVGSAYGGGDPVPWSLDAGTVAQAIADDNLAAARTELARLERWNPGSGALPMLAAAIDLRAGSGTPAGLAVTVDPHTQTSSDQYFALDELLHVGAADEVLAVVEHLERFIDDRRAWGVSAVAGELSVRRLLAVHELHGCEGIRRTLPAVFERAETFGDLAVDVIVEASLPCQT